MRHARAEIDGAIVAARVAAAEAVRRAVTATSDGTEGTVRELCGKWIKCFVATDGAAYSPPVLALLSRMSQGYESDELLMDSIASHLVGNPTSRWDDGTAVRFEIALREAIRIAEHESLLVAKASGASPVVVRNLTRLLEGRLREILGSLAEIAGTETARHTVSRLLSFDKNEDLNGNPSRSSR